MIDKPLIDFYLLRPITNLLAGKREELMRVNGRKMKQARRARTEPRLDVFESIWDSEQGKDVLRGFVVQFRATLEILRNSPCWADIEKAGGDDLVLFQCLKLSLQDLGGAKRGARS